MPGDPELQPWMYRDRVLQMCLALIPDLMELEPINAHSDAQAEYHEDELKKAAREWLDALDRKDPDPAILNQVIGYMKGKATARDEEAVNAPTADGRQELQRQAEAFRGIAKLLEEETKA